MWQKRLEDHVRSSAFQPDSQWLVLDGIPRNRNQARLMEAFIDVALVVHLRCEDQAVLEQRLGRRALQDNRPDDISAGVLRRRLAVFESESLGVLECYPSSIVRTIDASATPEDVFAEVLACVLGAGGIGS